MASGFDRVRRFLGTICACAIALAACGQSARGDDAQVRYDNHRVVRVSIRTERDLLRMDEISHDMWSHGAGVGGEADYRVSPDEFKTLQNSGIPFRVLNDNIQADIDRERAQRLAADPADGAATYFSTYRNIAEVSAYIDTLIALNPALTSRFTLAPNSVEGRTIFGFRISGPGADPKPAILIEGCQHAREWVSITTAMYAADKLIRAYGVDPVVTDLLNRTEVYVIPIINPDGYTYSIASNRLWRKNRRNNGAGSFGVDLNRNWGFQWGGSGASSLPSDETYRGASAFSEPETQALRDFIIAHPNIRCQLDWHSYSQLVLWPWGYTTALNPDNAGFTTLGTAMRNAILGVPGGLPYTAGPIGPTLYLAAGNVVDWTYGVRNTYSMTVELRDTGAFGFTLPASQIIPTGEENYAAFRVMEDAVANPIAFTPGSIPTVTPRLTPVNVSLTLATRTKTVLDTASPTLWYRVGNTGSYTPIAMTGGPTTYSATLPGEPCGALTFYYFSAATTFGDVTTSPNLALASPRTLATLNPPSCVGIAGDVNQDGTVNFADLNILLTNFGASGAPGSVPGDVNGDGTVSFADLNTMLTNFGVTG